MEVEKVVRQVWVEIKASGYLDLVPGHEIWLSHFHLKFNSCRTEEVGIGEGYIVSYRYILPFDFPDTRISFFRKNR